MESTKIAKLEVIGKLRKNKALIMAEILLSDKYNEILSDALNGDYSLFVPTDIAMNFLLEELEMTQHELVLHPALIQLLKNHLFADNMIHTDSITMVSGATYELRTVPGGEPLGNDNPIGESTNYVYISDDENNSKDDISDRGIKGLYSRGVEVISHPTYIDEVPIVFVTSIENGSFQLVIYFINGVLSTPKLNDKLHDKAILKTIDDQIRSKLDLDNRQGTALESNLLNDDFYNILQIIHPGYLLSEGAAEFLNIMIINLAVQILEEANIMIRYKYGGVKIVNNAYIYNQVITIEELSAASRKILPFDLFRRANKEAMKAMNQDFITIINGRRLHGILSGVTKVNLDWLDYDADAVNDKNYFTGLLQYIVEDILDLAACNFDERIKTKGGENSIITTDIKKVISEVQNYTIIFGRYLYL